MKPFGVL